MAWNESDLLADLATVYAHVSPSPEVLQSEDDKGITRMLVNVFEAGKSSNDNKQIGYRKNVEYYVFHRGDPDEAAYYAVNEPVNSSDKSVIATADTLASYAKIFASEPLRIRVLGSIVKAAVYFVGLNTPGTDLQWAQDVIKDPGKYLSAFMCVATANSNVRTQGAAVIDADLDYVINVNIPAIKSAFGFI